MLYKALSTPHTCPIPGCVTKGILTKTIKTFQLFLAQNMFRLDKETKRSSLTVTGRQRKRSRQHGASRLPSAAPAPPREASRPRERQQLCPGEVPSGKSMAGTGPGGGGQGAGPPLGSARRRRPQRRPQPSRESERGRRSLQRSLASQLPTEGAGED